jgi:iron complex outermembrane receptor protein
VEFYGVEGIIAAEVLPHLNVIGSFSYNHSEDESNIPYTATVSIPTKGKEFTDTPPWLFAGRVTYDLKDFTFGLQFNYVDKRYDTLVNDLAVPSYIVWNTDVRWRFDWIRRGTYLQLNVLNLFSEKYIGSLVDVTDTNNASLPYYGYSYADQGPPRTVEVTLRATF